MIILARRHGSTGPPVWNRALPVKISRVAREFAAIRCRERGHPAQRRSPSPSPATAALTTRAYAASPGSGSSSKKPRMSSSS